MNELIPGPTAPLMSATAGRDDPFQFKYGYNFQNEVQGPPHLLTTTATGGTVVLLVTKLQIHDELWPERLLPSIIGRNHTPT